MMSISRHALVPGLLIALAPAAFAAEEGTPFLEDPSSWALISLFLFFLLIWRLGAFKQVFSALDKRRDDIRNELDEAKRLREDAQKLLAETERRQQEAQAEADKIIAQAKADASAMMEQSRKDLKERLERREQQAAERIERASADAEREVRLAAADAATEAARRVLQSQSETDAGADQFKRALKD